MNKNLTQLLLIAFLAVSLGCSRTVDDVQKWKAKGNIEKLVKALSDPKMEVRIAAIQALGDLECKAALKDLVARLNDDEDEVVLTALNTLITLGDTSIITPLSAVLQHENEEARLKAVIALGSFKEAGVIPSLEERLDDSSEQVQRAAIQSIGQIGTEAGSAPLLKRLESQEYPTELRAEMLNALGKTGGSEAINYLLKQLPDLCGQEVISALDEIGSVATTQALEKLRSNDAAIRAGAILLLQQRNAMPSIGDDLTWYLLALRAFVGSPENVHPTAIDLAEQGESAITALIEAACHPDAVIRETACQALELIGRPCYEAVVERAKATANDPARTWIGKNKNWFKGDETAFKNLQLWGMLSTLSPNFPSAETIHTTLLDTERPIERAHIPELIQLLSNKKQHDAAMNRLRNAKEMAAFPLIATLLSDNELAVDSAAELLVELNDQRAGTLIMRRLKERLDAEKEIVPLYTALMKLNIEEAAPLLRTIRPNTKRASQLLEQKYTDLKVEAISGQPSKGGAGETIAFNVRYSRGETKGKTELQFHKTEDGEWLMDDPFAPAHTENKQ